MRSWQKNKPFVILSVATLNEVKGSGVEESLEDKTLLAVNVYNKDYSIDSRDPSTRFARSG